MFERALINSFNFYTGLETKTFSEFLSENKINGKVRNYLMDTVANATDTTDFAAAVQNVDKFIRSIGRYGNSPFLWTLYGSGELPQCFCRLDKFIIGGFIITFIIFLQF